MSARLNITAKHVCDGLSLGDVRPRQIGRLSACQGMLLEVTGFGVALGTAVRIAAAGEVLAGEVVGFRGDQSLIMPFGQHAALASGLAVHADGDSQLVATGDGLLGRVVDAGGLPLDNGPPVAGAERWPLNGIPSNPLARARVTRPFDVGVRAINGLLTVGEGQRVAIIAGSGVGKSVLLSQMLAGADCDRIVVGLIGERSREVADFVATKLPPQVRAKAVVVAVPGDHPPLMRLRAAKRATAIAEAFRAKGQRVLLLLDSLTRVAHAQRELGLAIGEPPTIKGYPPSVFSLIPSLVERAGAQADGRGSITALYTVLADGDDVSDPVVDTARAIVDGHIVLSRGLAEQGIFPAIDVAQSLSRTMVDCVAPAHRDAASRFRQLWSVYAEHRDLVLMGAYAPGRDELVDEAFAQRHAQIGFLRQMSHETVDYSTAVDMLVEGFSA